MERELLDALRDYIESSRDEAGEKLARVIELHDQYRRSSDA